MQHKFRISALLALIVVTTLLYPRRSHATTAELEVINGPQTKSQMISGDGTYNKVENKDKETRLLWDLSYTHSTSQATDASGAAIMDTTHDFTFGSGFETPSHWTTNLDLNYSVIPDENLTSRGPTLTLNYRYYFPTDEGIEDQPKGFHPSLDGKIGFASLNYDQAFTVDRTSRKTGITRPVAGNSTIDQRSLIGGLKWRAASWVTLKETYTRFSYNRDVNQFLKYIDLPVLASAMTGLSNALSGFYLYTSKTEINFYLSDVWELDLAHAESRVATDLSLSTENDLTVSADITDDWTVALGGQRVVSTSPSVPAQTLGVFRLFYYF